VDQKGTHREILIFKIGVGYIAVTFVVKNRFS